MKMDNTSIDTKVEGFCEHNGMPQYRVMFKDRQQNKNYQFCALSEDRCPYYKQHKQNGYCINYKK